MPLPLHSGPDRQEILGGNEQKKVRTQGIKLLYHDLKETKIMLETETMATLTGYDLNNYNLLIFCT